MFTGVVVGEVWASKKVDNLIGLRFLLVQPDRGRSDEPIAGKDLVVVADPIGAGSGERVIVAYGHAARNSIPHGENLAIEAAVIGIVDDVHHAPSE